MTTAAAPPSAEHVIEMTRMRFGPAPANLKVGDTIVWVNHDIVPHTATARDRSFDVTIKPHQSARVTMRRAGTIAIYCRFHPRSEERSVGKECGSTCRSRWSPYH